MFNGALAHMRRLEQEHGVDSVAFEMLGPPRLSKLLYESYLLRLCFGDIRTVTRTDTGTMSSRLFDLINSDSQLRSHIVSIGIPVLLPDGKSLLRGDTVKIPAFRGDAQLRITPQSINQWAHDGWVDLREENMELWRKRFADIIRTVEALPEDETSSRTMHNRAYWQDFSDIDPGKIAGWIFTYEEKGKRMKA